MYFNDRDECSPTHLSQHPLLLSQSDAPAQLLLSCPIWIPGKKGPRVPNISDKTHNDRKPLLKAESLYGSNYTLSMCVIETKENQLVRL